MNRTAVLLDKIIQIVSSLALFAAFLILLLFLGKPVLDFFGILSYAPPLNQEPENIVCVELTDTSNASEPIVLLALRDSEMDAFLEDFLKLKVKRYANDPPTSYGPKLILIHYEDGHKDYIGKDINRYTSPDGDSLPAGGWYYFPDNSMDILFDKYVVLNLENLI